MRCVCCVVLCCVVLCCAVLCCVVWCGVVWCGVVWCGVVCCVLCVVCCVVLCGVVWCCGVVVLWCCGVVVLWCCCVVVLLCCCVVVLWCCGVVVLCCCVVVLLCCCVTGCWLFGEERSTMRLCQRHRSQTPGVPATPEPSMTKNSSSSRAPKTGAQLQDNPEERKKCGKTPKTLHRRPNRHVRHPS